MENKQLSDRQMEALLDRLDKLTAEVAGINRRLEAAEGMILIARELATLNDSLQTLAYAAIGRQGPDVRRRRTG
jgi:DNA-binding FrmR family transcriptional regulator